MHLLLFSCRANVYRVLNFLPIRLHINSIHLNEMSKGITTNLGWVRGSDLSGNLKFIVTLPPPPQVVYGSVPVTTRDSAKEMKTQNRNYGEGVAIVLFLFFA